MIIVSKSKLIYDMTIGSIKVKSWNLQIRSIKLTFHGVFNNQIVI